MYIYIYTYIWKNLRFTVSWKCMRAEDIYIWMDCELHLANLANPNTKTKTVPKAQDQDRHSWKHQSTAARSLATTAMPEVGHLSEVVSMRNQSGQPIPE